MIVPRRLTTALVLGTLYAVLTGCASKVEQSSGPRPPSDPAAVKIYPKPPKHYEVIGAVEVPVGGEVRWDKNGDATPGFERLKAGAATRGANGLLLTDPAGSNLLVLAGYRGTFYQVPIRRGNPDIAVAQAIYVLDE